MKSEIAAWIDGAYIDSRDAVVPLLSHSFSRGSAVFEVMTVISTSRGPAFFCLDEHITRLFYSAGQTYMTIPCPARTIREALIGLARKNSVRNGVAKLYVYYPEIEFGTTPSDRVSIAAFCFDYELHGVRSRAGCDSVSVGISPYRKLDPSTTAVHAKVTGNYVNGYLARMESKQRGFDEALMLDTHGHIAEGPTANIFLVRGTTVETPTEENVLPGITRRVIMEVLSDMGYPEQQAHIRPENLDRYEEAFFSGTTNPVQPIRCIESKRFTCPGKVTTEIRQRMQDVLCGKVERFERLLTYI